MQETSLARAQG